MKFTVSPSARRDLDEIWDYIAQDSPESADRVLEDLYRMFGLLAANRFMGREEKGFGQSVRAFPHKAYLIFYLPDPERIEVMRVLHSARDIPAILERDFLN